METRNNRRKCHGLHGNLPKAGRTKEPYPISHSQTWCRKFPDFNKAVLTKFESVSTKLLKYNSISLRTQEAIMTTHTQFSSPFPYPTNRRSC